MTGQYYDVSMHNVSICKSVLHIDVYQSITYVCVCVYMCVCVHVLHKNTKNDMRKTAISVAIALIYILENITSLLSGMDHRKFSSVF